MFVIVQCLKNVESREESTVMAIEDKIALTMKQAGVAISVTSVTDVACFLCGAVSILPVLQDFCIIAALTIGFIFLMQVTWFVACLTLDQQRIEARRDGCFCCIVRTKWSKEESNFSLNWTKFIMGSWSKGLSHFAMKVRV